MDEETKDALELLATSSRSPQVRERAVTHLKGFASDAMLARTARMALNEPEWTPDQLRTIGALLAIKPEDHSRSAKLPVVRMYPDERERADELAETFGVSLAEWIRLRVTTTESAWQARRAAFTSELLVGLVEEAPAPVCARCDQNSILYVLDSDGTQWFTCVDHHGQVVNHLLLIAVGDELPAAHEGGRQ